MEEDRPRLTLSEALGEAVQAAERDIAEPYQRKVDELSRTNAELKIRLGVAERLLQQVAASLPSSTGHLDAPARDALTNLRHWVECHAKGGGIPPAYKPVVWGQDLRGGWHVAEVSAGPFFPKEGREVHKQSPGHFIISTACGASGVQATSLKALPTGAPRFAEEQCKVCLLRSAPGQRS